MTLNEKKDLLVRNMWSLKEARDYLNMSHYNFKKVQSLMKETPPFVNKVYRDEVLRVMGTSTEKEIETLSKIKGV